MIFSKRFWIAASERALKTFAQFFITLAGAGALDLFALNWQEVLGLSLGGVLLSYATSIVSAGIVKSDNPDLTSLKSE
jgi:hypothetical protein